MSWFSSPLLTHHPPLPSYCWEENLGLLAPPPPQLLVPSNHSQAAAFVGGGSEHREDHGKQEVGCLAPLWFNPFLAARTRSKGDMEALEPWVGQWSGLVADACLILALLNRHW